MKTSISHKLLLSSKSVVILSTVALTILVGNVTKAEGIVNIYNWSDYIAEDHVANFAKKYDIKTQYDAFDSNETLHAKLVAGGTGYDIVVPSAEFGSLQIKGKLLQALDKSKIPNYKNLDAGLMKTIATLDPDNKYLVPWAWGYTTLGINVGLVSKALGDLPMPDDVWELLFNPKYVSKLKSCGVSLLDAPSEVLPAALFYLNKNINSDKPADYKAADKLLASIRPSITLFDSSGYINDLASGALCLSMGWSGDISIASRRAKEVNNGHDIRGLIPSRGAIVFYDTMAIPKDAKNVDNAHKWINYYLEPKISASMTNEVFYANPNKASLQYVQKDIAADKSVFLEANDMKKLKSKKPSSSKTKRLQTRSYTRFKSGK